MANSFASVRAVVFDAAGTLTHPQPAAALVYLEFGRRHGSRLTLDDIARNFSSALKRNDAESRTNEQLERVRWRRIVADVFTDLDETESLFDELWEHFSRATSWAIYDDVAETLAAISKFGFITAIGSNFDERLIGIASKLPPLDKLDAIFVSSQLGYTKPSLGFFRGIEHKLRLRPSQLLIVGDDIRNDIEGGSLAGWHSLLLNRGGIANGGTSLPSLSGLIGRLQGQEM